MGEVKKLIVDGQQIILLDFSNTDDTQKIEIILRVKQILLTENRKQLLLSNYADTFITSLYMQRLRVEIRDVLQLIDKQAVIGLNEPKKWIIKGFNLLFNLDIQAFDSAQEAIDFLVAPSK